MNRTSISSRAARWSATHRRTAILGWIALVVISLALGSAMGTQNIADEDLGNGDSRKGEQVLANAGFPEDDSELVLIQGSGDLDVDDPQFHAAVADVEGRLAQVAHVTEISSPLEARHSDQVSADRRSALIEFELRGTDDQMSDRVEAPLAAVAEAQEAHPELRIEQFGDASADKALDEALASDFERAEFLSLPITLLILIVAFGALVAAGVPLLLGLTAVAMTLGLLGPISQIFPVDEQIGSVIMLVGLAVGVDYSLFYLRRARAERRAGHSNEAALAIAAATSGRAVLVSGLTVMVAMAGMFLTGNSTFMSFGIGTIVVVAVAVLGSLTVLPAVLSKLGDRVEKGRVPLVGRLRLDRGADSPVWSAILDRVLRRPLVSAVLAGGILIALAIPSLRLNTVESGVEGLPRDLPVMETYERIQEAFPGGALPAVIVIEADDVDDPAVIAASRELRDDALASGLMNGPVNTSTNPDGTVRVVTIPLEGDGTNARSIEALETLREDLVPATLGELDGVSTYVTGMTAGSEDFNAQMSSTAPLVFAFVLGLAFLLLMVTFRSIVIAVKAIVLNLLSVGAAYGVLVWVFQDGHGESLLGFESSGGITSWLPLFLFVLLFGLSMDYHVFILSRVREAFDRGMTTSDAVAHGIKSTAGVVTSAAVVMIAVFSVFATLSSLDFKQMGVGLAVAVLIDATIVRAVLLPATMKLLGDWNWYLPSWLGWLPRLRHEPEPEGAAA
jgi:RND superfamily putative drug exporter